MHRAGRLGPFGYAVLLRALVTAGFIFTRVVAAAMWSSERRSAGLWLALLVPAVAALRSRGLDPGRMRAALCAAQADPQLRAGRIARDHRVAPILTLIALAVLVRALRASAGRARRPSGKLR